MSDCARGCRIARKHQAECDQDECKGCQPREAEHGMLCAGCYVRLLDWLKNAPGQHALLKIATEPSLAQALKADVIDEPSNGAPSPLNVAAASAMTDLTDILSAWVEMLCEQDGMHGPIALMTRNAIENPQGRQLNPRWSRWCGESVWCDPPKLFEIHSACTWLTAQVERLTWCPGIGDLWNELGEAMSQAHALAPWREQIARIKGGITCPCCHRLTLTLHGGSSDVQCDNCNEQISPARFQIWSRMLEEDRREA